MVKFSFRIKKFGRLFYFLYSKVEYCNGISSVIGDPLDDNHIILMDFDNIELSKLEALLKVGNRNIYIFNDGKEGSYRVLINKITSFNKYVKYMSLFIDNGLDFEFFRKTIQRGYGTIRISNKNGRKMNEVIKTINCDNDKGIILDDLNGVIYLTDKDQKKIKLEVH